MDIVHVPLGIAQAVRDRANELLEDFTKRRIPLNHEGLQMWSSLRDARDSFFIAVTTNTVTMRILLRLKCAIKKSERFVNRYCPA
jgi:hypothetical protein